MGSQRVRHDLATSLSRLKLLTINFLFHVAVFDGTWPQAQDLLSTEITHSAQIQADKLIYYTQITSSTLESEDKQIQRL